ncbi:MAG: hypothetical protein ACFFCS_13220 [Candidatus Hodarchaeota archaeon]
MYHLELSVHPSFTLKPFSTTISFFVESVYSTKEKVTSIIVGSSITIGAVVLALAIIVRWRRSRGYRSTDDFWVKVKVE